VGTIFRILNKPREANIQSFVSKNLSLTRSAIEAQVSRSFYSIAEPNGAMQTYANNQDKLDTPLSSTDTGNIQQFETGDNFPDESFESRRQAVPKYIRIQDNDEEDNIEMSPTDDYQLKEIHEISQECISLSQDHSVVLKPGPMMHQMHKRQESTASAQD